MNVKILTLNVWNTNRPVEDRQSRIVDYLCSEAPEIVALQEISPYRSGLQSDWIAKQSGYPHVYYNHNGYWQGREEGLAILTTLESSELDAVNLPLADRDMPRTLQLIQVTPESGYRSFIVGNTHLAFHIDSTMARKRQVRAVLDALKLVSAHEFPVILCGDLNDVPESEPVRLLFNDPEFLFQDSWVVAGDGSDGFTFSRENPWASRDLWPGRRIDFIAASKDFLVHSCSLTMTPHDVGIVSDHYGLLSELSLQHNA